MNKRTNMWMYLPTSPVDYYYESISRDTFDLHGRLVNNALILTIGKYFLEEAEIKSNGNVF